MYLISMKDVWDATSITASEEVATFEVGNLQTPLGTARWRSTGLTPSIVVNFAASVDVDTWGVYYSNASSGDQARLRLANTQGDLTVSPSLDTGMVDVWPGTSDLSTWPHVHQRATVASTGATWARVDFDFTGNVDGYVQASGLCIGARITVAGGHKDVLLETKPRGQSGIKFTSGGMIMSGGTRKRNQSVALHNVTEVERHVSLRLLEENSQIPVGMVLSDTDTQAMTHIFYGYATFKQTKNVAGLISCGLDLIEP